MLEVIQFEVSKRFAVRNTLTGIVLHNKRGKILTWRNSKGAVRYMRKVNRSLNKTIARLNQKGV